MREDQETARTDDPAFIPYPGQGLRGGMPDPPALAGPEPGEASDQGGPAGPASRAAPASATPASGAAPASAAPASSAAPARLTARGAGLAMFSVFFPGTLTAGWLHLPALTGLSFLAGCILAGLYTRRPDLLVVVTLPPVIFLISLICVKAMSSSGNALISTAEGCLLTLASVAAWLFGGVAVILIIALFRGLPRTVAEHRAALRGGVESEHLRAARYGLRAR
jgi:hypothetical protein